MRLLAPTLLLTLWLQEPIQVWLCPMHQDVQSAIPGECSICKMPLEERRLRSLWSCPMHPMMEGDQRGSCPICDMKLVQMTKELVWTCARHPDLIRPEPGTCPADGELLSEKTREMPHGDHNPRHGGIFFMAPNGFHHLEGALSETGVFRLYLYDNFTRPIDARLFQARISDRSLAPGQDGAYLEGPLPGPVGFPAELVVHVCFGENELEERFDFVFAGARPRASPASASFQIPGEAEAMVAEILVREARIQKLMQEGAWTELFIPALEAKELALALHAKAGGAIGLPVKTLVRAAWLLDLYGDQGNRPKVESAYRLFEEGVRELRKIYAR